ncbi:MAG: hypothetical protein GY898_03245 [Proteobacteria bacterium]|nr:hypothetical protein [Pseudomonadota bacterium]
MRLFAALAIASAVALPAVVSAQDRPAPSCAWRTAAADGTADDPTGDPGAPWDPARRLNDAGWRQVEEHFQAHHFGLFSAEDVAALESTPGVALGVLHPLPDEVDGHGRLARPEEAAPVQWPDRIAPTDLVLVAVGNARPGEDWVLHPAGITADGPVAPIAGPATAPTDPSVTGFYRVHRLVGGSPETWRNSAWAPRRLDINALELETELALSSEAVALEGPEDAGGSPQVLASGTFSVRTRTTDRLDAPLIVNLSLRGPGSSLFILEVLPRGDEIPASGSRNVRVDQRLDFQILAPPSTLSESAFTRQLLPPGQAIVIEVAAEIVSFAGQEGGVDLDLGLSSEGFSVAPGEAVVFSPVEVLPRDVVQRSVWLEIWRPDPARE